MFFAELPELDNACTKKVKNMQGKTPKSKHCVANAVQRVTAAGKKGVRFFFVVF